MHDCKELFPLYDWKTTLDGKVSLLSNFNIGGKEIYINLCPECGKEIGFIKTKELKKLRILF